MLFWPIKTEFTIEFSFSSHFHVLLLKCIFCWMSFTLTVHKHSIRKISILCNYSNKIFQDKNLNMEHRSIEVAASDIYENIFIYIFFVFFIMFSLTTRKTKNAIFVLMNVKNLKEKIIKNNIYGWMLEY